DFNHWDGKLAQPVWGPRYLSSGGSTTQAALYATTRISLFGPLKVIGGGRLSYFRRDEDTAGTNAAYRLSYKGVLTP
ncbi:TonB-dependent receptor domain-containing protein, partial [Escherichia coli]|uniref:TonB-dependent receptor domain-containing protein n=1 Tax=Escherichia coli TaxID=562 RepID=UPI001933CF40